MTAREHLHAEIEALDDRGVEAIRQIVHQYVNPHSSARSGDLFSLLRGVTIDGPVDFAANLDLYMNGEKSVSDNIR
jgi:hypothetical protein